MRRPAPEPPNCGKGDVANVSGTLEQVVLPICIFGSRERLAVAVSHPQIDDRLYRHADNRIQSLFIRRQLGLGSRDPERRSGISGEPGFCCVLGVISTGRAASYDFQWGHGIPVFSSQKKSRKLMHFIRDYSRA